METTPDIIPMVTGDIDMPMNHNEAGCTLGICLRYMPLSTVAKLTRDLDREVGEKTENESLKATLKTLAAGSREMLIERASKALEEADLLEQQPWHARVWAKIRSISHCCVSQAKD
jgi:hypothetical protein